MTREDIVRMAKEAGMESFNICVELDDFAKLVAEKAVRESSAEYRLGWNDGQISEREACAKLCDEFNFGQAPQMIQKAIRARGQA